MKTGYFIPEFPGQTHAFFWREMLALQELGVTPDVVSTRRPKAGIAAHDWAIRAAGRTNYLCPLGVFGTLRGCLEVLRTGPVGWTRVARCVFSKRSGATFKERARLLPLAFAGACLSAIARKRGWDQIHVHSCANAANVAMFANRLSGIPYSLTLHGPLKDYGSNQKNKWRHACAAIVITQQLLKEVHDELSGNLPPTIRIAPMGVQVEHFERHVPYEACQNGDKVRIVSCGRLNPCKGHDDLIRMVAILRQRGIEAELRICGTTDNEESRYDKELRDLAVVHGVASQVKFLGSVSEEEVRRHLSECHFFALASLAEPLGVATMEAMSMGVPVIVTRAGGVTELVQDGHDGILVDGKEPSQIADAIQHLVNHPEEAVAIGKAARERIETAFHHRVSAETLAEILGVNLAAMPSRDESGPIISDEALLDLKASDVRDTEASHPETSEAVTSH